MWAGGTRAQQKTTPRTSFHRRVEAFMIRAARVERGGLAAALVGPGRPQRAVLKLLGSSRRPGLFLSKACCRSLPPSSASMDSVLPSWSSNARKPYRTTLPRRWTLRSGACALSRVTDVASFLPSPFRAILQAVLHAQLDRIVELLWCEPRELGRFPPGRAPQQSTARAGASTCPHSRKGSGTSWPYARGRGTVPFLPLGSLYSPASNVSFISSA